MPASIIACAAARIVSQVPVRLTANTRCHCSGDCANNVPAAPIPAHATTRMGAPCSRTVWSIAAVTAAGSLMSQSMSPPT
jgi:hypothetical protein